MKTLKFLLAGVIVLAAFAGCSDDVDEPTNQNQNQNNGYDDSYYAKNTSISSSDDRFAISDEGAVISFNAFGGEVVVNVDCGIEWTAKNNADDIFGCTIQSKSVTITAGQNLVGEDLTGTITLMTAKRNVEFATITVTQAGQAYVTLSPEELSLPNIGSTNTVMVESNYDWDYSYDSSNGWFTVEKNEKNSSLSVTCSKNETGSDREGVVTVTAGDGDKNVAETELKITQSWENPDALILEYTITDNNTTIRLPIYSIINATIDWDDGNIEDTSSNLRPWHKYSTPGIYTVTVNGTVKGLSSSDSPFSVSISGSEYLTSVKQWGNIGLTSMENAFCRCSNLITLPSPGDAFANVTTFDYAFYYCTGLESIPSDLFLMCEKAESFDSVFRCCSSLTDVPENIFSSCLEATNFGGSFWLCSSLTNVPENMFSNCTRVTDFSYAFCGCTSLTTVSENMFSNCTKVTDFSHAFRGCSSLVTVPENMFSDCTATRDFSYTFCECSSLTSAPSFEGLSKVTSFCKTFYDCTSLTSAPSFKDCSSVSEFDNTFYNCTSMVSAPTFEGCSKVTTFASMFSGFSALTTIPKNMFSGCTAVTTFYRTFYNCSSLKTVPVSLFDDTLLVLGFGGTFYGCSSIVGESPYTEADISGEKVKIHLYEREDNAMTLRWAIPTSYSNCFTGSTFSDIDSIPSSWGGNGN